MRKVFALCMITVACIVSTTACGAGNSTNRAGSDTSDSVREITNQEVICKDHIGCEAAGLWRHCKAGRKRL